MSTPSLFRWRFQARHWLARARRLRAAWLPLAVGGLSLAITVWLWWHEHEGRRALLQSAFQASARQLSGRIEQRLSSYEQLLRGAQGLFSAHGATSQPQFERYMAALMAGSHHTGLRTLAYLPSPAQPAGVAGQPLSAPGRPGDPGQVALNPGEDAALRQVMAQAGASGQVALSGPLMLVPRVGHVADPGFLMFLAVYQPQDPVDAGGAPPPAQRQARLLGWVWATFSVGDMMSSMYGDPLPGLSLALYEGGQPDPQALLYGTASPEEDGLGAATLKVRQGWARMTTHEFLDLAGHSWLLVVHSEPEFERRLGRGAARTILAAGLGLSLLLPLLSALLLRGRAQAVQLAKLATGELRESELRYRRIVETTSEGIWMLDAQGRTSFANPRLGQMLGWPLQALQGQPLASFLAAESPPLPELPALTTRPGPGPVRSCELCLRRADGGTLWVALAINPIAATPGQPAGVLAMVRDISARKQAERQQAQLEAQLRESQKLEAIGTLAGGIAHDFNNILAAILGNVALARQQLAQGGPAQAAQDCLGRIEESGSRARSLVQQILAFSRQQAPALLTQPLQPLVEEAARLLRATLPAGVQLALALDGPPLAVRADATQIQQVLMNLCTNAWHAMQGRKGRIDMGAARACLSAPLPERLAMLPPGDYACLWVQDDGCGMSAETLARLFEPFFTTKGVGQGTGLGLAVVHGIVATHGGAITVRSEPGRGSRFELYLPLQTGDPAPAPLPTLAPAPAPAPAPAMAPPAAEAPAGRGEHVLVVDDDPAIGLIVERLLHNAGYRVSLFAHSPAALAALQQQPGRYDLVLSDFNMPELSGLDLARACAALRPGLPVVISSGYLSDEVRQAAREAGVRALLQKEFSVEQLPALVRRVLDCGPEALLSQL